MPELVGNRFQRDARGESSVTQGLLTLEIPQKQKVAAPRPCRVTIGVDVSSSMTHFINPVIGGIEDINSVLNDGDLVSVRAFAASVQTVFPYKNREKVDWDRLGDNLRGLVTGRIDRRDGTALWDAIVQIIQETPWNKEFQAYKPELIIFTDGWENCSENNDFADVKAYLEKPRIAHVHITIIDASVRGNPQLREVCAPIQHCSYMQVEASQEAIQRAFKSTMVNITARLEVPFGLSDTAMLGEALMSKLRFDKGLIPSAVLEETRGESSRGRKGNLQQGRSNNASRNRSKSHARNNRGNGGGNSQRNWGDQKNGVNSQRNGGNGESAGGNCRRDNNKNSGGSGGGSGGRNAGKAKKTGRP